MMRQQNRLDQLTPTHQPHFVGSLFVVFLYDGVLGERNYFLLSEETAQLTKFDLL